MLPWIGDDEGIIIAALVMRPARAPRPELPIFFNQPANLLDCLARSLASFQRDADQVHSQKAGPDLLAPLVIL